MRNRQCPQTQLAPTSSRSSPPAACSCSPSSHCMGSGGDALLALTSSCCGLVSDGEIDGALRSCAGVWVRRRVRGGTGRSVARRSSMCRQCQLPPCGNRGNGGGGLKCLQLHCFGQRRSPALNLFPRKEI